MSVFHACDIRGIAGTELTYELAEKIAYAIGTKLSGQTVVVGGDIRLSTPRMQQIMMDGLARSGCEVINIGTVATPLFYFAQKITGATGGVMVTASHNPASYNGFKLVMGPKPVSEEDINEIARLTEQNARVEAVGSVRELSVIQDYIDYTVSKAKASGMKVVLDAGNGAASHIAPNLYRQLGFEVVELFCEADGTFPNRPPNPAVPENLSALSKKVLETGAFLGIAFDGDGDRVGFVDETGRAVDNDDILVLLAQNYLETQKGPIIYDAKCSMVVPEQISKAGGKPIMARAGHTFSKSAFIREKALFAGEISGHFFFSELGYDDGMFAGLKMCEYISTHGPLSVLIDEIPNYILTPEIRVRYTGTDKEAILAQIAQRLSDFKPNLIDGVRIEFDDGWAMIRASVTEPLFTLRFEAKSSERLNEISDILLNALPDNIRELVNSWNAKD
ncbi:phosphomannomutase/phosphoglucomutase [Dendrosporobacter sp. 1207_IL3150]|uniref:phosphomannomutase/phosphoglucomutase n=1 Tax=Dendrosporobacter sp. 1207_IL3150 TaxID=3084054 RepID=UPI002FDA6970